MNTIGQQEERHIDGEARLEWTTPTVSRMRAGDAENDPTGASDDGVLLIS